MDIMDAVLDVFERLSSWFPDFMTNVSSVFWTPSAEGTGGALTMFGALAVIGLGISVIFLVIGVISNFLHFRG